MLGVGLHTEIPLGDARLLEEHDLTNVLNQIPVDAFNDLFQGKFSKMPKWQCTPHCRPIEFFQPLKISQFVQCLLI